MKVRDAMTENVVDPPGRTLREAAVFMLEHNVGAAVIWTPRSRSRDRHRARRRALARRGRGPGHRDDRQPPDLARHVRGRRLVAGGGRRRDGRRRLPSPRRGRRRRAVRHHLDARHHRRLAPEVRAPTRAPDPADDRAPAAAAAPTAAARGSSRKRSASTAMFTLAGKTASIVAISHQPAQRDVRPQHAGAAGHLRHAAEVDELAVGGQRLRHDRLVRPRLEEVQRAGGEEEGAEDRGWAWAGAASPPTGDVQARVAVGSRGPAKPCGRPPWASR